MFTTSVSQSMKQIIIMNDALQLPRKKRAVQIARASAGAFFEAGKDSKKAWLKEGSPKIVLNVIDEDDLQDLFAKAEKRKLPICLVQDKVGLVSAVSTIVCLGIGPVTETQADQFMEILNYYRWVRESALNARIQEL